MSASENQKVSDAQSAAGVDEDAAQRDRMNTQKLLSELATSIALLPQEPPAEGEERPEGAITLPVIEQGGTQYIPVFLTEDALRAAGADPATAVRLPIAELAANWPGQDLWLAVNPANEDGLALPPDVVRSLPGYLRGSDDNEQPAAGPGDAGQTAAGAGDGQTGAG
ncbi:MAG: hypothetical protein QOF10_83 [Kribbellaceae bacterium]|jgi:hypothetical protein|nr:hypothetical protein [Kribbellaceae bacterium]